MGYSSLPTLTLHYKNRKTLLRGRRVPQFCAPRMGRETGTFLNFVILLHSKIMPPSAKNITPGPGNARVLLAKPQCGWYNNSKSLPKASPVPAKIAAEAPAALREKGFYQWEKACLF